MSKDNTTRLIISSATTFYNQLQNDKYGRYRSWEHCYIAFCEARKGIPDIDYLSLILAFYLASWGMYRGSSFLLQRDYKVHIPVVKELLKSKYDCLVGIKCKDFYKPEIQKLVFDDLQAFMKNYYRVQRSVVSETEPKQDISDTLITKILMGTLACVPAYDRYFIQGIKNRGISTGNYNKKSILMIADYYSSNEKELEIARNKMRVGKMPYPQMKMIDMGFWQIGFDFDKKGN